MNSIQVAPELMNFFLVIIFSVVKSSYHQYCKYLRLPCHLPLPWPCYGYAKSETSSTNPFPTVQPISTGPSPQNYNTHTHTQAHITQNPLLQPGSSSEIQRLWLRLSATSSPRPQPHSTTPTRAAPTSATGTQQQPRPKIASAWGRRSPLPNSPSSSHPSLRCLALLINWGQWGSWRQAGIPITTCKATQSKDLKLSS